MTMGWFKLHNDILSDIKLRRFSPLEKWAWIVLLALASQSENRGFVSGDNEDLASICEFNTTQDWLYYRDKLIAKGMVEIASEGVLRITHWEQRQYQKPSDRPEATRERKQRQRAATEDPSRAVTPVSRAVTPVSRAVTPSHATDQIRSRSEEIRSEEIVYSQAGAGKSSLTPLPQPWLNPDPATGHHTNDPGFRQFLQKAWSCEAPNVTQFLRKAARDLEKNADAMALWADYQESARASPQTAHDWRKDPNFQEWLTLARQSPTDFVSVPDRAESARRTKFLNWAIAQEAL